MLHGTQMTVNLLLSSIFSACQIYFFFVCYKLHGVARGLMSKFMRCSMRIIAIGVFVHTGDTYGINTYGEGQALSQAGFQRSFKNNSLASSSGEMDETKAGAVFLNIFRLLLDEYVDHIGTKEMRKMLEGAVHGMLSALDPHSGVVQQNLLEEMEGQFGGLGIQISPVPLKGTDRTELRVVSILEGSPKTPAQIAGIKPGDIILAIDRTFYDNYNDAIRKMRGTPGTKVVLTIKRESLGKEKIFNLFLTRAIIKVDSVKSRLEPNSNIGYIRIGIFDAKTSALVEKALRDLYKANPKLNCIVIDLRNNYGGYLDQAIKVASLFLSSGAVVKIKDKKNVQIHSVIPKQVILGRNGLYDAAVLVLVNGYSASASEILAAAFKDHNRAIIAGRTTFGKGSVQEVRILDSDLAFKFTSSRFYSPKGSPIQGAGVIPHIILKNPQDMQERNIVEIKETNLSGALEGKSLDPTLNAKEKYPPEAHNKTIKPSSRHISTDNPPSVTQFNNHLIRVEEKNSSFLEPEVDYELVQAMDLAKALGEQFEQYTLRQDHGKKK